MIKRINNEGSIAILAIGIIFILVFSMTAYVDITSKTWALDEIQSIMDTSGINALQSSVDLNYLRAEILAIDKEDKIDTETKEIHLTNYEAKIRDRFDTEFSKLVDRNSTITDYKTLNQKAYFVYNSVGMGKSKKARPQVVLDTTMLVKLKNSTKFDISKQYNKTYENKIGNDSFQVTYKGKDKDGSTELVIRSVTRLVYR